MFECQQAIREGSPLVQDMGPFAGGLCLLEVLKPAARSIYNGGLDSRQQQAISQAAVELLDSDLDLDDAW